MASHRNTRTTRSQSRRDDRYLELAHQYYIKCDERRQNCVMGLYAGFGSFSLATLGAVIYSCSSTILSAISTTLSAISTTLSTISTTLTNIIPFIALAEPNTAAIAVGTAAIVGVGAAFANKKVDRECHPSSSPSGGILSSFSSIVSCCCGPRNRY
jgi:hypothetical protein